MTQNFPGSLTKGCEGIADNSSDELAVTNFEDTEENNSTWGWNNAACEYKVVVVYCFLF